MVNSRNSLIFMPLSSTESQAPSSTLSTYLIKYAQWIEVIKKEEKFLKQDFEALKLIPISLASLQEWFHKWEGKILTLKEKLTPSKAAIDNDASNERISYISGYLDILQNLQILEGIFLNYRYEILKHLWNYYLVVSMSSARVGAAVAAFSTYSSPSSSSSSSSNSNISESKSTSIDTRETAVSGEDKANSPSASVVSLSENLERKMEADQKKLIEEYEKEVEALQVQHTDVLKKLAEEKINKLQGLQLTSKSADLLEEKLLMTMVSQTEGLALEKDFSERQKKEEEEFNNKRKELDRKLLQAQLALIEEQEKKLKIQDEKYHTLISSLLNTIKVPPVVSAINTSFSPPVVESSSHSTVSLLKADRTKQLEEECKQYQDVADKLKKERDTSLDSLKKEEEKALADLSSAQSSKGSNALFYIERRKKQDEIRSKFSQDRENIMNVYFQNHQSLQVNIVNKQRQFITEQLKELEKQRKEYEAYLQQLCEDTPKTASAISSDRAIEEEKRGMSPASPKANAQARKRKAKTDGNHRKGRKKKALECKDDDEEIVIRAKIVYQTKQEANYHYLIMDSKEEANEWMQELDELIKKYNQQNTSQLKVEIESSPLVIPDEEGENIQKDAICISAEGASKMSKREASQANNKLKPVLKEFATFVEQIDQEAEKAAGLASFSPSPSVLSDSKSVALISSASSRASSPSTSTSELPTEVLREPLTSQVLSLLGKLRKQEKRPSYGWKEYKIEDKNYYYFIARRQCKDTLVDPCKSQLAEKELPDTYKKLIEDKKCRINSQKCVVERDVFIIYSLLASPVLTSSDSDDDCPLVTLKSKKAQTTESDDDLPSVKSPENTSVEEVVKEFQLTSPSLPAAPQPSALRDFGTFAHSSSTASTQGSSLHSQSALNNLLS